MHVHIIRNSAVVGRIRFVRHLVHTDMIVVSCDVGDYRLSEFAPRAYLYSNARIWIDAPPPDHVATTSLADKHGVGRTIDFDCWRR